VGPFPPRAGQSCRSTRADDLLSGADFGVRSGLAAGGRWIRTFGPPSEGQRFRGSPFERMQKAANAQKRDGESDAVAFSRWITHTAAGKTAYAEDRHAALTDACKVYRFPRCSVLGHRPPDRR
jgi:hypothetical protein